jgi:hypothetical protein
METEDNMKNQGLTLEDTLGRSHTFTRAINNYHNDGLGINGYSYRESWNFPLNSNDSSWEKYLPVLKYKF